MFEMSCLIVSYPTKDIVPSFSTNILPFVFSPCTIPGVEFVAKLTVTYSMNTHVDVVPKYVNSLPSTIENKVSPSFGVVLPLTV